MTAPKKLFLEIILLACFLAFVVIFLEWKYSTYKTGADNLIRQFEERKAKAEILWIGNSHTLPFVRNTAGSPDSLRYASLAYGGTDLFRYRSLLFNFMHEIPGLKMIIAGIDEDLIGYNQHVFHVEYGDRAFYKYTGEIYSDSRLDKLLASSNFFRANRDPAYLFGRNSNQEEERPAPFILSEESCRQRAAEHSEIRFDLRLIPENTGYLREIASISDTSDIKMVWFIPPKTGCYLKYRNGENAGRGMKIIKEISKEKNILLIDMNEEKIYADSLFSDSDHLNEEGARQCFEDLMNVLQQRYPDVKPVRR